MNPTYLRPLALRVQPTSRKPEPAGPNAFDLWLRYRAGGNWQVFLDVYVPNTLQAALQAGDVAGLHFETLEINSASSRRLAGAPGYLVLGIETRSGTRLAEMPRELTSSRRADYAVGIVCIVLGAALLGTGITWVGALTLTYGTHRVRNAREIPGRPFDVLTEIG